MPETQTIEYKEIWKDEWLKHICAFANSNGGSILIGIKDNGIIAGVKNSKKLLEEIPNKVIQLLGISVDVDLQIKEGREIVEISVSQSSVPVSLNSRYYIRSGTTVQEVKGQKLREFILKKDNITWDEITIPQAKIDELDNKTILRFISKAVNANRLPANAIKDDIQLTLKNLDLINEQGNLTRAAILLFGNRPNKYIKTATVKIGRFGKSEADLITHDVIEGNIFDMPDRIIEILRAKYLHSPISYNGLERIEQLQYPEKAIREAVINAIVHRDYGENTDITIHVFDDKLVIWNSGELISPLNIEMLKVKHPSKRRNVIIANVFFRIGYIEAWGRGIKLMTEEMEKFNLPKPNIEEYAGGLQISFLNSPKTTSNTTSNTTSKATSKTTEKIFELITNNPIITAKGIAILLQLTEEGVRYHIKKLKKANKIQYTGPAKGGHWKINE